MDVAGVGHAAADLLGGEWSLQSLWAAIAPYSMWLAISAFLIALALSGFGKRVRSVIEEMFFTNWQLTLLGSAALILSLAGGWTTWDGMRNFTGEPVLSLMFTFGIHGVMLIVAWLIGESFATGMSSVPQRGYARATAPLLMVIGAAVLLLAIATVGAYAWSYGIAANTLITTLAVATALLIGTFLLLAFSGSDIVAPYTQALRIIIRNSMLWVMFIACMSTSVFFSFDSRFNVVFPQEERKRVADLRAQNQVTGILADIGGTITQRRLEQSEDLFKSQGWRDYDANLVKLATAAQTAQGEIEQYFVQQMEERRRGIAQQQERITTAQSGQIGLANKKLSLTDELSNTKAERPRLAAEYAQHKTELDTKRQEADAKRIEAMAEDRGVEGTGKVGKGQVYRERMGELGRLLDEIKIREERTRDAQRRLNAVESRVAQVERELTGIDGEIAKMKGEAQTAEMRIKAVEDASVTADGPKLDPARALLAFENARSEFRQEPNIERLAQVQQLCTQLNSAMSGTPATKERVRSIDCDPKQASEAAGVLFALNAGFKSFENNCSGGDKLAQHNDADGLFGFARKCLADSGLPSKDTDALRTKISFTELTRDDRAHRFVVSWNAFGDGNRLAYLALAIAIGIDSLIFMTGLFGANAVRSPLSDVPSSKARNAHQLEAVIETALLPDKYENANAVIDAMHPITPHDGFTAEVVLPDATGPGAQRVLKVLNAAATIGAVARDTARPHRYLVRGELFEFLSSVAKKAFESDKRYVDMAELERVVTVALLPRVGDNAETVLSYLHPIGEKHGFTGEIRLDEVLQEDRRTVRSALNAGATLERVQRAGSDARHYYIHGDFYKALARIRGRLLASAAPSARFGGVVQEHRPMIEGVGRQQPALTHSPAAEGTQTPAAKASATVDLDAFVTAKLLKSIGIEPRHYNLLLEPDIHDPAINAGKALDQLRDTLLGHELKLLEKRLQTALDATVRTLEPNLLDDVQHQTLTQANQRIHTLLPALMLTDKGPFEGLLREMIGKLQEAAAPDAGHRTEDHEMLQGLRMLEEKLAALDRQTPTSWFHVGNALLGYEEASVEMPRVASRGYHTKQ
ncbi:MAG: hypothetical protein ACKVP3_10635 [Hyphomicrobiaceae bacterium]